MDGCTIRRIHSGNNAPSFARHGRHPTGRI
jgi:hypothetical protein